MTDLIPRAVQEQVELELRPIRQEQREPELIGPPRRDPRNVDFVHDPRWRERFWSLTCAKECNHPVWWVVAALYYLAAGVAWPLTFALGLAGDARHVARR